MNSKIKLFVATKAFIEYQGKVLIVKESPLDTINTHVGEYDVIGGRLTPGESLEDSLKREILEETGLKPDIGNFFFANESRPVVHGEPYQVIRIFYRCQASNDQIVLSNEHDEFLWIDPRDYQKYSIIKNLFPAFEAYLKII
jgi:8-oxo-dGTP diphosphatase